MKAHIVKLKITALAAAALAALPSCLENDIPYPTVEGQFLSITVEGQSKSTTIDTKNYIATLNLSEQVDINNVNITDYSITEGATISVDLLGTIDMSRDHTVTITTYQDYTWTLTASQTIERYFTVEGQVGSSVIDTDGHRAVAYVSEDHGNTAVTVTSIKLGPEDVSTMTPDLTGETIDFSSPQKVTLNYFDNEEQWTVYVETTDVAVSLTQVDAWTNVMWVYGEATEGSDNGFEYRQQGDSDWTRVPSSQQTDNGGTFYAYIKGLSEYTTYEVRAVSDDLTSDTQTATTEGTTDIPNFSFDDWHLDGKIWYPWAEDDDGFWDTGNRGATTLGDSNSIPCDETWDGNDGKSAELASTFVGVGALGKLAAGNLFTGSYKETDGTNGILDFGQPFTGRPTKLKGHLKYSAATISHTNSELTAMKGQPDTAVVYIALTNWSEPFEVRTRQSTRNLFDSEADYVIAYGELQLTETVEDWTEFTIDIDYNWTDEAPSYILIVSSASKYGDYFTGGDGGTLWVDDFSLEWDY